MKIGEIHTIETVEPEPMVLPSTPEPAPAPAPSEPAPKETPVEDPDLVPAEP